jgi:hypothetical protein
LVFPLPEFLTANISIEIVLEMKIIVDLEIHLWENGVMNPIRPLHNIVPLLGLLTSFVVQLAAAAQQQAAATANGSPLFASLPVSLFPVVGLIAAVGFTQLLHRRRALQLQALPIDRG